MRGGPFCWDLKSGMIPLDRGLAEILSWVILSVMPMTLDQLVEETRQLPQDVRAELVERILLAAHGGIDPRIEDTWKRETRIRLSEVESGEAQGRSLDEVLAAARKRVGL